MNGGLIGSFADPPTCLLELLIPPSDSMPRNRSVDRFIVHVLTHHGCSSFETGTSRAHRGFCVTSSCLLSLLTKSALSLPPQTGGASGIGRATAELFSQNQYKVVVADRSVGLGEAVVANLKGNGEEAAFVELDVANEASVQNCVDFAVRTFGGLDCAVNSAGITGPFVPANETPLDGWQKKMNTDLTGCLMFTKACVNYWLTQEPRTLRDDAELGLPPVRQRGALVNVASFNGLYASKNMVSHGALYFWGQR